MGAETETGDLLYGVVRLTKPLRCLETGTAMGDTAFRIGTALKENGLGHLYTCEIDDKSFAHSTERLKDLPVTVIQKKGIEVITEAEEGFDFVFIDSWWIPVRTEEVLALVSQVKVNPRGIVCLHDVCQNYAPVSEALASASGWPNIIFHAPYGISMFQAPDDGLCLRNRGRNFLFT
jgi:predicted O-methyltransferase YrrM